MAYIHEFSIVSGLLRSIDTSLSVISPYYNQTGSNLEPCISISCTGDTSAFNTTLTSIPNTSIQTLACIVPSGFAGPATVESMLSNYVINKYTGEIPCITSNINGYSEQDVAIITKASIPGTGTTHVSISGNMHYTIYATHALIGWDGSTRKILGYGNMVTQSYVLTYAPVPISRDVVSLIEDLGDSISQGNLTTFSFTVPTSPNNFMHPNNFGVGYPGIAASGMLRMTCSGVLSGVYFPALYDGTNSSTSPIYQYGEAGDIITWKVPKKLMTSAANQTLYADYEFNFNYINSSGNLTPSVKLYYSSDNLSNFYDQQAGTFNSYFNNDATAYPINVGEDNGRGRIAFGIRDINLVSVQYNEKGTYVSSVYTSDKPIYAISMKANDRVTGFDGYKPQDLIKYYIQFADSGESKWFPISPNPRTNELDSSNQLVPSIYLLDSSLNANEQVSDIYNVVSFINLGKEQYNFRIKIEIDTNITGTKGKWTPQVFDYSVAVIDREALMLSNFERYIFN